MSFYPHLFCLVFKTLLTIQELHWKVQLSKQKTEIPYISVCCPTLYCNFFEAVKDICLMLGVMACIIPFIWSWRNEVHLLVQVGVRALPRKKGSAVSHTAGTLVSSSELWHPWSLLQLLCCCSWNGWAWGGKARLWIERNVGMKTKREKENEVQSFC